MVHLASLASLLLTALAAAEGPVQLDRVVAAVDGQALLRSELLARAAQRTPAGSPSLDQALESLIEERLLEIEARRLGVRVSPEEVERALAAIASQNGLEREALLAALLAQGLSEAAYRALLGRELLRHRLVQLRLTHRPGPAAGDDDAWQARVEAESRALLAELADRVAIERLAEPGSAAPAPWPAGALSRVTVTGADPWRAALGRLRIAARPGEALEAGRVAADLATLWADGHLAAAWAEARPVAGGLELTYHTRPRPVLGTLRVRAPAGLGQAEVRKILDLAPQAPLDPVVLERAQQKLAGLLRRRGYLQAELAWHQRLTPSGLTLAPPAELCLEVKPGPRYRLGPLRFSGHRRLSEEELRACLGDAPLELAWSEPDQAAARLQGCYFDRGMIAARVEAPQASPFRAGRTIALSVRVEEGEVYSLGRLRVEGALVAPEADYLRALGWASGRVFSRAELQAGLARLDALHRELGRAELQVDPRTEIDPAARAVHLTLEIEEP